MSLTGCGWSGGGRPTNGRRRLWEGTLRRGGMGPGGCRLVVCVVVPRCLLLVVVVTTILRCARGAWVSTRRGVSSVRAGRWISIVAGTWRIVASSVGTSPRAIRGGGGGGGIRRLIVLIVVVVVVMMMVVRGITAADASWARRMGVRPPSRIGRRRIRPTAPLVRCGRRRVIRGTGSTGCHGGRRPPMLRRWLAVAVCWPWRITCGWAVTAWRPLGQGIACVGVARGVAPRAVGSAAAGLPRRWHRVAVMGRHSMPNVVLAPRSRRLASTVGWCVIRHRRIRCPTSSCCRGWCRPSVW